MMGRDKEALSEIARELMMVVSELDKNLMNVYVLREADDHIRQLVEENYSDSRDASFLVFFYTNLRHHLWTHVAADVSLRMTDEQTKDIINKIKGGLNGLAESLERYDKAEIYNALVTIVFDYLNELNTEVNEND